MPRECIPAKLFHKKLSKHRRFLGFAFNGLARVDGGRIAHTALSAVEQALWDIAGQHLGAPIHALCGGKVKCF